MYNGTMKKIIQTALLLTLTVPLTAQTLRDSTSVTGATSTVTQERMNKGMITNSLDALSGQAAGVQVQSGGNHEAMLSAVRVRGTTSLTGGNDPLVVIDGVQSDIITLSTIYPADIESFTILKDASETSQYGSRGAAGVIQVVTRKGTAEQFHIAYDGSVGLESTYKNLHMLNASQFRQAASNLGMSILDKGADTDFTKAPIRTGLVQTHHLAFGGGSETANYRASIGMTDQKTTVKNYNLRNYIAKLDLHQKAFDNHLTVDLGVLGSLQNNNVIPSKQKLFYSAATFNPTIPAGTNASGGYDDVTEAWWINNPYALLTMKEDEDDAHVNVHAKATINLGYGLTLGLFGSYSYSDFGNAHYYPTYVWSHGEAYQGDRTVMEMLGNIALNWRARIAERRQLELYEGEMDGTAEAICLEAQPTCGLR
jgi:TonB-dependent SusC/RagA subfamily outer membrane receptor